MAGLVSAGDGLLWAAVAWLVAWLGRDARTQVRVVTLAKPLQDGGLDDELLDRSRIGMAFDDVENLVRPDHDRIGVLPHDQAISDPFENAAHEM